MILVTGSTGRTGRELVALLAARGAAVRALVRDPARASRVERPGVELVHGDLADRDSVETAMAGVTELFLLSSPDPSQVELQRNAVRAARSAGVRRIVKLSARGAGSVPSVGVLRWHGETEREIEDSGLRFTHLRPTGFMQNALAHAAEVALRGEFQGTQGTGRVPWIDLRDVAAVAAEVLLGKGHDDTAYELTGPESLSQSDLAARLSAAIERPVAYVDVSEPVARQAMLDRGLPDWLVDELLALDAWWRTDADAHVTDGVRALAGRPPRTFDAFAREVAPVFLGRRAGLSTT